MALQSALSRLRTATTTNHSVSSSENILKSTNVSIITYVMMRTGPVLCVSN